MQRNMALRENTINCLLETSAERFASRPALGMALEPPLAYGELFRRVQGMADTLRKEGVRKGDPIAILGENSPNWGIACLAVLRLGAVVVPILPEFPEADIHHILLDSEAKILFTTQRQMDKVLGIRDHRLKAVITLDDFRPETDVLAVEPLSRLLDKARDFLRQIPDRIGLRSAAVGPDDVASIIYTSGTSGHSKAVMLTHGNFVANVLTAANTILPVEPDWTFLSILPLSHSYEFTLGFLFPLLNGARVVYVGKTPTPSVLEKICRAEKPQVIPAVPLIMEKIYKKKVLAAFEKKRLLRLIARVPGLRMKIYRKIRDKLVDFFGGELRVMAIGGAAINREAELFLRQSGFPYLIGYGLTETAPLLAGGPWGDETIAVGSTGKPIAGVEIRIDDPDPRTGIGEIVARGPNVMKGYFKNPEATRAVLDEEGWFRTGDLGCFDRAGNLHIRGRSKNMILMSNGENIYPEAIEDKINSCMHVAEALVLENGGRLEALVYLDYDLVDEETRGRTQAQKREYIDELLLRLKDAVNPQLPAFAQISRFIEHEEPFQKTATSKIKRYLYAR